MTTIDVKNTSGKKAGSAELAATVFEIEPNMHAMHEVVRSQRAARRAGTHNTFCLLYTSPSPRDPKTSRMPSSA